MNTKRYIIVADNMVGYQLSEVRISKNGKFIPIFANEDERIEFEDLEVANCIMNQLSKSYIKCYIKEIEENENGRESYSNL